MDYFKILNFDREPFSNSPDPDFFYESGQHLECLQKMELSVRLRRGLSVVIGDVGTGKTTLCRQIIRKLSADDKVETHLILDPYFSTPREFLSALAEMMSREAPHEGATDWQLNEIIKRHLFQQGVDRDRITVLIIDEGQKIPAHCLEILRELLNYETNAYKLLQVVIFAQREFQEFLDDHHNFADRINMRHDLLPLGFRETRAMIQFRLERAHGMTKGGASFSRPAVWAIYRATRGYPRKIINLCHRLTLNLIVRNRTRVTRGAVKSCTRAMFPDIRRKRKRRLALLAGGVAVVMLAALVPPVIDRLQRRHEQKPPVSMTESAPLKQKIPVITAETKEPALKAPSAHLWDVEASLPPAVAESGPKAPDGAAETKTETPVAASDPAIVNEANIGSLLLAGDAPIEAPYFPGRLTLTRDDSRASTSRGVTSPYDAPYPAEAPRFLGRLAVKRGDYLVSMIRKIYGRSNNRLLASVVQANEQLRNPDLIEVGQVIRFPAPIAAPAAGDLTACWIQVGCAATLEEAYGFIRKRSTREARIRMIPCWTKQQGLRFILVFRQRYPDKAAAEEGLNQLPEQLFSDASVIKEWEADTIFFGLPFDTM
ncbi:MAG: AAA family ATPase [Deltaproteobacteria bacterium]|nr:AAA family ATPase [Deltaproteobacteria bacterium]